MLKNEFDTIDYMHKMFLRATDTSVSYTTFDFGLDCLAIGKMQDGDIVAWYPRTLGTVLAHSINALCDYLNTWSISAVGGLVVCKNADGYSLYPVTDNADMLSVFTAKKQ